MDTSETYIKMCDCPEIQLKKKIRLGDYMGLRGTGVVAVAVHMGLICRIDGMNIQDPQNEWIKLPRQDQVQEMCLKLDWVKTGFLQVLNAFYDFVFDEIYEETENQQQIKNHPYKSMEQLWLAFYMLEKHGKVWDGKKWKKK